MTNTLPPIPVMRRAFAAKDASFDGTFFAAVRTTGVFCRPVCRAKPARPENLEFFPTAADALRRGYRPCKLCRPLDHAAAGAPDVVARLLALAERAKGARVTERDLRAARIDPSTARRRFRAHCGMTFAAYQRARRLGGALGDVRRGTSVTAAQVGAGYESGSGFRGAFARTFGARASRADDVVVLTSARIATPLGLMIAITSDAGVVLCDFHDRKDLDTAMTRLRARLGSTRAPAAILSGEHPHLAALAAQLAEYFDGRRRTFDVPLAPHGTPFELNAWRYLREIPFGQTRSYGAQAAAVGRPQAVRAVGRANGRNVLPILIPCHRVVAATGALTGYAGGVARKRWLLDHERRVAAAAT
jgi:AraC family transcriptional regulator, regulatory protein of adaptative response / methylated-DNA-[protein]-cysteine methyltransferase